MRIVVLISADAEWRATKALLQITDAETGRIGEQFDYQVGSQTITFFHGGWGRVSAAASTQFVIDTYQPDLLLNLGTCGGFAGRVDRGTIILVERSIIYDILEQMTDAAEAIDYYSTILDLEWLPTDLPSPVLRSLLVSGDRDIVAEDIPRLVSKYGAIAADWESGAIAWVAARNRTRLLILRGVSDLVGSEGGEAYGNYDLFNARTLDIISALLHVLPQWIDAVANLPDSTAV